MVIETGNSILLPGNSAIEAIAITPDGKHVYVPYLSNSDTFYVAVIDTGTNTVVQSVLLGLGPAEPISIQIAVTPDGKYVYVPTGSNDVAVIETTSNTIIKTVAVGSSPTGIAVTPDGVDVYVANQGSNSVSAVSTASNEIHPDTEPVKLQVGPFIATIAPGSFKRRWDRSYTFEGVISSVRLEARIELRGGFRYAFHAEAKGANFERNDESGASLAGLAMTPAWTSVKAHFDRVRQAHRWSDD